MRAFGRDIAWSIGAWKVDPRLAVAALCVSAIDVVIVATSTTHSAPGIGIQIACMATWVWLAGFRGVERRWYDQIGLGFRYSWRTIREAKGDLRSRFLRLGLVLIPFAFLTLPLRNASPAVHYGVLFVTWGVIDALLTFVTVQLALVTDSVIDALTEGLALLRSEWPACAMYVLAPPLGVQFLIRAGAGFGTGPRVVATILVAPLALACRGATVRYYDREVRILPVHAER